MLTKTDFLDYLDCPMHFWAVSHGGRDRPTPSEFDQLLMQQGQQVEKLARQYLESIHMAELTNVELTWQRTFEDGDFQARTDGLIYHRDSGVYDVYEIKSVTSVKKEHKYDVTFQSLVYEKQISLQNFYLLHLNKEYVRDGSVLLDQLFTLELMNETIDQFKGEVQDLREQALFVSRRSDPIDIQSCTKPEECSFPDLCHPDLPVYSIYELPRIGKKSRALKKEGILAIKDIPPDFKLSERQAKFAQVVNTGRARIDYPEIKSVLENLKSPLFFLDYETFSPAVPMLDGYSPYQHIVFQYSLHVLSHPGGKLVHYEYLGVKEDELGEPLLQELQENCGTSGSVIVWNQAFEVGKNKQMMRVYPSYDGFLEQLNSRVYDLMEIFSRDSFIHPDFKGSASIKKVLPVLVPELSYTGKTITGGTQAMVAWLDLYQGGISGEDAVKTRQAMLDYCELDTLAMVEIWRYLKNL